MSTPSDTPRTDLETRSLLVEARKHLANAPRRHSGRDSGDLRFMSDELIAQLVDCVDNLQIALHKHSEDEILGETERCRFEATVRENAELRAQNADNYKRHLERIGELIARAESAEQQLSECQRQLAKCKEAYAGKP